jgi:hypothetical protein
VNVSWYLYGAVRSRCSWPRSSSPTRSRSSQYLSGYAPLDGQPVEGSFPAASRQDVRQAAGLEGPPHAPEWAAHADQDHIGDHAGLHRDQPHLVDMGDQGLCQDF